jgi:sec-independent protein translocase protein TatC
MSTDTPETGREMTFLEHVGELRSRLIKIVISIGVFSSVAYYFWRQVLLVFTYYPLRGIPQKPALVFTSLPDSFLLSLKVAFAAGLFVSFPVVIYQIWAFVAPGLYRKEKSWVVPFMLSSTLCFLVGASFAYFVIIPLAFKFLISYTTGILTPMITINEYIGFIVKILLAFGLVFEMPVMAWVGAKMGFLTPRFLWDKMRYSIVIIFIVAAVLTPPDVVSQVLMALPLLLLYFISILVTWLARPPEKEKTDAE